MNSDLANKLAGFEAAPPEEVWQSLSAALDNGVSSPFAKGLHDYSQAPSALAWNMITDRLDAEASATGFTQKLYDYQQTPPAAVWAAIEAALHPGASHSYPQKLYGFNAEPPVGAWEVIAAQLAPAAASAKVVPLYRKYARHTGVAALFALAIFFTSILISKKTESDGAIPEIAQQQPAENVAPYQTSPDVTAADSETEVVSVKKEPKLTQIKRSFAAAISNTGNLSGPVAALSHILPQKADRSTEITSGAPADKYMIYSDDEGNAIKLPKKIFDSFACSFDETNCKERLKCMQEQLSAASFSTDFTSVMEMISNLQGK